MNDEGVGIAGWLLADLALVLAIVFLAFTPAALTDDSEFVEVTPTPTPTPMPEPTVASPVILDIGCAATAGREESIAVRCEPDIGGGAVASYRWEADRGSRGTSRHSHYFAATFDEPGAVRLTVSNDSGEHSATFAVLAPLSRVVDTERECSDVQTDFRFSQIVLQGADPDDVAWGDIRRGRVREDVIKSNELDRLRDIDEGWADTGAEAFLREKRREGLRIALVETFSNAGDRSVELSQNVNNALFKGLRGAGIDILRDADHLSGAGDERWKWFGDYLATRALDPGEVRINLYFVKPFDDEDCE